MIARIQLVCETGFMRIFAIACGITFIQILLAILVQGQRSPIVSYEHLNAFDSVWYQGIAEKGYFSNLPRDRDDWKDIDQDKFQQLTNIAFLPAYPLLVHFFHRMIGIPFRTAMLLVSQAFCVGFWIYLQLFLNQLRVSKRMRQLCILSIIVYPSTFFLVTGYSESLFLFFMMGFLYWCNCESKYACILAGLHGFAMSLTRILGLVVSLYALIQRRILVTIASMMGVVVFFTYLHFIFGYWDFYLKIQRVGWLVVPDYLFPLHDGFHFLPTFGQHLLDPNQVSANITTLMFWILVLLSLAMLHRTSIRSASSCVIPSDFAKQNSIEGRKMPNTQCDTAIKFIEVRYGLLSLAIILFYLQASAVSSLGFRSMSRYCLPVFILLAIIVSHRLTESNLEGRTKYVACIVFSVYCIAALTLQLHLLDLFTHKEWVG